MKGEKTSGLFAFMLYWSCWKKKLSKLEEGVAGGEKQALAQMQLEVNSVTSQAAWGKCTRSLGFEKRVTSSLQKNKEEFWLICSSSHLESISSSRKHKGERVKKGRNRAESRKPLCLLSHPCGMLLFSKFNCWLRSDRRSLILMMLFSKPARLLGQYRMFPILLF